MILIHNKQKNILELQHIRTKTKEDIKEIKMKYRKKAKVYKRIILIRVI